MYRFFFLWALCLTGCASDAPPLPLPSQPQPTHSTIHTHADTVQQPIVAHKTLEPKRMVTIPKPIPEPYPEPYPEPEEIEESLEIRVEDIRLIPTRINHRALPDSVHRKLYEQTQPWFAHTVRLPNHQDHLIPRAFSNGLAFIDNNRWTDTLGYLHKSRYTSYFGFQDGKVPVLNQEEGYLLMDTTGRMAMPGIFYFLGVFNDGLAAAALTEGMGYVNEQGDWQIAPQFYHAQPFSEGLAAVAPINTFNRAEYQDVSWERSFQYGFINTKGEMVIAPRWEYAGSFHEGMASFARDDEETRTRRWGFINRKGKIAVRARFGYVYNFSEELAAASLPPKHETDHTLWGFIDKKGRWSIKPCFWRVNSFAEGLAAVQDTASGHWGFIDKKGDWAIQPQFEEVANFSQGLAVVKIQTLYGAIDSTGTFRIPPVFERLTSFQEGYAIGVSVARENDGGRSVGIIRHPVQGTRF